MLIGAAVALVLIAPAFADGWESQPQRSFDTHGVHVENLVGNLSIAVKDGGPATVQVSGQRDRVNALTVTTSGDTLEIEGEGSGQSVWDWHHWLDFTDIHHGDLSVKLTVPKGTSVHVEDLVGNAQIGDIMAPLHFSAASTNSTIGRVTEAHVTIEGSGRIAIGDISGDLHAETDGDGKITAGNAHDVHAELAGSGAMAVGAIRELHLSIAGSGDFTAARVNGPTKVEIAGSGSVNIAGGEANPLHLDIAGSGNFTFGGVAVDPKIDAFGSGNVRIKSYRGKLSSNGMADVKIGDD
jgi:hypothetical protein